MENAAVDVVALTADVALARHLLAVTAAVGIDVEIEPDAAFLRPRWRSATLVLVGVDQAGQVADLGLPRRSGVYVVGVTADRDQTHAWSARLGAAVVTLPDGRADLTAAVAEAVERSGSPSRAVCVLGGSGGVGTSTLAAALAVTGARSGLRTLLVDGDADGGGIDLLLGAEHVEGWRWPRLVSARGHLGDLGGQLPRVEGVDVLATARSAGAGVSWGAEQVGAVLASGARTHDLVVVDVPRHLDAASLEALRRADEVLLVVRADVRGVAAGRQVAALALPVCRRLHLVVRLGRTRSLPASSVAEAVGVPLRASVEDDPTLPVGAERGASPARVARSPLARTCRRLLGPDDGERSVA